MNTLLLHDEMMLVISGLLFVAMVSVASLYRKLQHRPPVVETEIVS